MTHTILWSHRTSGEVYLMDYIRYTLTGPLHYREYREEDGPVYPPDDERMVDHIGDPREADIVNAEEFRLYEQ